MCVEVLVEKPLLIDAREAARFVGVTSNTIRRWCAEGLPFARAGKGGKKMFIRADLRKWVERLKEAVERTA
jgi:excisionase family DNA binding protein